MLRVLLDLHARMGEQARLKQVFELCDFERGFTEASLRRLYPEADERELFLRSTARRLERELMIKVYGWDPEEHR